MADARTPADGSPSVGTGRDPPTAERPPAASPDPHGDPIPAPAVGAAAVLVLAVVAWLTDGAAGVLAAATVAIVWSVTGVQYAVAVGGVVYVLLVAPDQPHAAFVATALAVVAVADVLGRFPRRTALAAIAVLVPAAAVLSETARVDPTWQGALAAAGGFAVAAYVVHRYGLVQLGLVEGSEA